MGNCLTPGVGNCVAFDTEGLLHLQRTRCCVTVDLAAGEMEHLRDVEVLECFISSAVVYGVVIGTTVGLDRDPPAL